MTKLRSLFVVAIRTVDNHYVCGLNTLLDGVQILEKGRNVFI